MSRTFSTNSGSVDSLKVSLRCGCSEKARQMRCTVEGARPDALAIDRVLQYGQLFLRQDTSVSLSSEDSQEGLEMRLCGHGQDRTHPAGSWESGKAGETGEKPQHAAEGGVASADRVVGR